MTTMYPGKVNSPPTTLVDAIDSAVTTITITDASVLPIAPNLATIGSDVDAETILFTTVTGNTLEGVTRGFQGTAKTWPAGTPIARLFTEYDYRALSDNINSMGTGQSNQSIFAPAYTPPSSPNAYDDEFNDQQIDASWVITNAGAGLTWTETQHGLVGYLDDDQTAVRGLLKSCPIGNFRIETAIQELHIAGKNWSGAMLIVADNTTKAHTLTAFGATTDVERDINISRQEYNPLSTRNIHVLQPAANVVLFQWAPLCLAMDVYDDAGIWKVNFEYSRFGTLWRRLSTGITLGFTPAQIGIGMYSRYSSTPRWARALFRWFRVLPYNV